MMKKKSISELDRKIMLHVQSMERDIPSELEDAFLQKIEVKYQLKQDKIRPRIYRRKWFYYATLATAAVIIMAVLIFIYPLFNNHIDIVEAEEVWVQSAKVEGEVANTFVVNPKESDLTIVWIEKIKNSKEAINEKK